MSKNFEMDLSDDALRARLGSAGSSIQNFLYTLGASEYCLIDVMVAAGVWTSPSPPSPPANYAGLGSLDLGTCLFLINNQQYIDADSGAGDFVNALEIFVAAYNYEYPNSQIEIPASNLPSAEYDYLSTNTLIASDGSVLSTEKYDTYDQYWVGALDNFLRSIIYGYVYDWNIPSTTSPALSFGSDGTVTVGLLSDWGTGSGEASAASVMSQLSNADPDCVIHLGDVYYSGSPTTDPGAGFGSLGEEKANLLDMWQGPAGKSFTLNSNHEMYSGAYGYFQDALGGTGTPFGAQSNCSMFAVAIGDWTILGLDSAYNSDVTQLFMYGSLDDASPGPQMTWIKSLGLQPSKTIVLTHHNGFDFACAPTAQANYAPFWAQVNTALGGDPYAWYWGHIHYGVAYLSPVTIAESSNSDAFTTDTYCRCLGHGALPFGITTELTTSTPTSGQTQVEWMATEGPTGDLLYNGYVTLVFTVAAGVCTSIVENFFDIGSTTARLSRTLYSPPPA